MFTNYFKLAFRNFKKRKGHAFINIVGLAIAVASCLFVAIYVQNELSYDAFYEKQDRMYRVVQTRTSPEKTETSATTPFPLASTLKEEFPQWIETSTRFYDTLDDEHTLLNRSDTTSFLEYNFNFVDSTFFDVFEVDLLRGNPETALDKPLSLVMTREKARKYFGDQNPIGKTLSFEGVPSMKLTITGIMEPPPVNSHVQTDVVASFSSVSVLYKSNPDYMKDWFINPVWTYIVLAEGVTPEALSRQLPGFVSKYYRGDMGQNETVQLELQPVPDIHLYSDLNQEMGPNGSIFYVYLFSTAAFLLLIIACINFMNLATARATERSSEVGMRKALGAYRSQLFAQFMGEAFLMSFIAVFIAAVCVALSMPFFSDFLGKELAFSPFRDWFTWLGLIGLVIIVGTAAGFYPALYLSRFQPSRILQESSGKGRSGSLLRKGLVVLQFSLSVILVIGTIVVFMQLRHMQQKELGFDTDQIVIMPISQNLIAWEYPTFKERLLQNSAIKSVTGTEKILSSKKQDFWRIAPAGKAGKNGETNHALWVTHDFVKTYGLNVIAGRAFSKEYSTDGGGAIMINQEMVKKLGYDDPQQALGEIFYYTPALKERHQLQVVGVVENFNYTSVKRQIQPMVICLADNLDYRLGAINYAVAKLEGGRIQEALAHIENVWSDVDYIDPFTYSFQDEEVQKTFASEATTKAVMNIFTILCLIVACLGLFGLASFTASRRTKEIGIRKAMGASVENIVARLSGEYIKLVIIANVIAWPVVYYLAQWWLQDFAYRFKLGWNIIPILLLVGLASILICLLTVSYQSIKAAWVNPVESLRNE